MIRLALCFGAAFCAGMAFADVQGTNTAILEDLELEPEVQQSFEALPPERLGMGVRAMAWDKSLKDGEFQQGISAVLELSNGCTIPPEMCTEITSNSFYTHTVFAGALQLELLSSALMHADLSSCDNKREGIPAISILTTGKSQFTVFTEDNQIDAACFVRVVGS